MQDPNFLIDQKNNNINNNEYQASTGYLPAVNNITCNFYYTL